MKNWILIQARSTSSRFPNKIMADLGGKPVLSHTIDRCLTITPNVAVIIPTGDPVKEWLNKQGVKCFEGPENDVLRRYLSAMDFFKADAAIRITSDCPLVPRSYIAEIMMIGATTKYEFISNCIKPQVDGYEVEYFTYDALVRAHTEANLPEDREHVTTHFKKNLDKYDVLSIYSNYLVEWFPIKLSIDTPQDLENIREIYEKIVSSSRV
jgi:spore coat polysaccharide biosynthesis protein SpsF